LSSRDGARCAKLEQQQEGSVIAGIALLNLNHVWPTFDEMMIVDDAHDKQLIETVIRRAGAIRPQRKIQYGRHRRRHCGVIRRRRGRAGAKVALITQSLRGDCLNVGCVPSKA
jgi:hypothetical protein